MQTARIVEDRIRINFEATAEPEYTFAVYEVTEGDCGYLVVDVIVAPWNNGKSPRFYYLKKWATRNHNDSRFIEEVITDFNEANDLKSGWYRMNFNKFTQRIRGQAELQSVILYGE